MVSTDTRKIYKNPADEHEFFIIYISSVGTKTTSNLGCNSCTMFTKISTACTPSLARKMEWKRENGAGCPGWEEEEKEISVDRSAPIGYAQTH